MGPRGLAAVWSAQAAALASRALRRGGGTAVAGLAGLALEPDLVARLAAQLGHGCVIVTGTNGKTTTSRLIAEAVARAGLLPLANASGSNLMRGLASSLALAAAWPAGRIPDAARRLGVFEVDEATVPLALGPLRPRVAVFGNLFRDQLDRYGEVETVASLWRAAIAGGPADLALALNADDPLVASLGEDREGAVYFGVDDPALDQGVIEHAADALNCRCGGRLRYEAAYFGHVGIWHCPACGRSRPAPRVRARDIDLRDGRSAAFGLEVDGHVERVEMALGGLYNVYNALAATAAALALGLPSKAAREALAAAGAAFGRQEAFDVDGRSVELFLGKNPAGLNQVLATLALDPSRRDLLVVLNDGIADGRDISWVWDADFERAAGRYERVTVSGNRAWDMALRLKYAGWDEAALRVAEGAGEALEEAVASTPRGACLSVIPTYTAMLGLRATLAQRTGRGQFWQP